MTEFRRTWWSTIALAALLLLLAGCGGGKSSHARAGTHAVASPPQLNSIQQLRSVFNAGSHGPTLVVLIAPT